jgi:hypothetical protein
MIAIDINLICTVTILILSHHAALEILFKIALVFVIPGAALGIISFTALYIYIFAQQRYACLYLSRCLSNPIWVIILGIISFTALYIYIFAQQRYACLYLSRCLSNPIWVIILGIISFTALYIYIFARDMRACKSLHAFPILSQYLPC